MPFGKVIDNWQTDLIIYLYPDMKKANEEVNDESVDKSELTTEQESQTSSESGQGQVDEESPVAETTELLEENQKLQQDIAEAKDKYIRLYSEFENFRRRTGKEKLELIQTASEQVLKELLPVLDDFERAEAALASSGAKELEGFLLISSKFRKIMERNGVKTMELGPGSEFDADMQEAITQIPAADESLKGKVVDVVEKGYLLNEKVIRYAKVVVGS